MKHSAIPTPAVQPHRPELERELGRLRHVIDEMGRRVATAISRAAWGYAERSADLCSVVVDEDGRLNELQREAHEVSYVAILTQAPVAIDLREILSLLHMAGELERMGDHCVSIAKMARTLVDLPPLETDAGLPRLAEICSDQVRDILTAVMDRDPERARGVALQDDRIDRAYHRLFNGLVEAMTRDPDTAFPATNVIFMAHHLERIGDRVTNIAEDLVFQVTGRIEELG